MYAHIFVFDSANTFLMVSVKPLSLSYAVIRAIKLEKKREKGIGNNWELYNLNADRTKVRNLINQMQKRTSEIIRHQN